MGGGHLSHCLNQPFSRQTFRYLNITNLIISKRTHRMLLVTFLLVISCLNFTTGRYVVNDTDRNANNLVSQAFVKNSSSKPRIYYSRHYRNKTEVCAINRVCNKIDIYGNPWVEKQCECPGKESCSMSTYAGDGYTIMDRTRMYKICQPVKTLKMCTYFRDITWTVTAYANGSKHQIMKCQCPKNSVTYLVKSKIFHAVNLGIVYKFSFACSPQANLQCTSDEPCRLFSIQKSKHRPSSEEVTTSLLCQCPEFRSCPKHHLDKGVITGKFYDDDSVKTFTGYCT